MKILVVGGAGYIGSHMVLMLGEQGHQVSVLDDLSSGHEEALLGARLIRGSVADTPTLARVFSENSFDAVMHFASFIQVGESVIAPAKYYGNNLVATINLLDAMVKYRIKYFIFSSTAAIFGQPEYTPIDEAHPQRPINPYGRSKRMVEEILSDYDRAYGLKSICLRYFNAAGADSQTRTGERHDPETHLIPLLLKVASGRNSKIDVYGRDYPTPDGTCIRDYIHVVDLCSAHALALAYLAKEQRSAAFNLGNGNGFSVQQVIDTVCEVTGKSISVHDSPRREGDPAVLVADAQLARSVLGWAPAYPDIKRIVGDAWKWEQKLTIV